MNLVYFGSVPADIRIRINPDIRIRILAHLAEFVLFAFDLYNFWNSSGASCSEHISRVYFHRWCKIEWRHLANDNNSNKTHYHLLKISRNYRIKTNVTVTFLKQKLTGKK